MKQASNKSNQQQASKSNDTPIGAMSVVDILKELAKPSNKTLYTKIQNNFNQKSSSNINNCTIAKTSPYIIELVNINLIIMESIQNIEGLLNWFINDNQYTPTPDYTSGAGMNISSMMGDNQSNNEFIATGILGIASNIYIIIDLLTSIDSTLIKLDNTLTKLDLSSTDSKTSKANGELFNFAEQVEKLKNVLDTKFILNWERFVNIYKDFIDKKNTVALIATIVQIVRFSHTLTLFYIGIGKVTKKIRELSRDLVFLGLVFIIPPFSLGIIALKHFIRFVKTEFNIKSMLAINRGMTAFQSALLRIVLAAIAMNYVKWDSLVKLTGILAAMVIVLNKFTGKANTVGDATKTSISKSTTYNISGSPLRGMFGLCMGLMFLVIALNFIRTVNWQGALFVVGFIALLGATLFIFGKYNIAGSNTFKSMSMLALGLAVLILSLDAANELNWMGAIALTTFIVALGVALGLSNKIAGGGVSATIGFGGGKGGMFTFALGLAVLILCIDSVNELNFITAMKLVAFIMAIQLAIHAPEMIMRFSKKKFSGAGGKMSGIFGFALGLAVLILCIDAIKEIQFTPAFLLIVFITALIGILKYGTEKIEIKNLKLLTIGLILFIAGVGLAIGLAYLCISKNAWQAILTIIATIVAFIFVSKLVSKNWVSIAKANKIVPAMIAAFVLTNLAFFWLLSKVNLDINQILLFAFGVSILIGLILIVNKFSKNLIAGTIILLFIGVASILLAHSVKKITEIKFNLEGILTFVGTVIIIGALAALFGIPVVAGIVIVGAVTLIILSIIMTLAAIGFSKLSIISALIFPETINKFINAIGILCIGLFKISIFTILALPAALTLIPITISVIISAISLMIISTVSALIFPETINKFTDAIGILCIGLFKNSFLIGLALIPAGMLLPIIIISTISAIAMIIISTVSALIFPETINKFTKSIERLVLGYNKISIFSLIKAGPKTILLIPIALTTILIATAFKLLSLIDIDENKIDKFGIILGKFITMMCDVINQHSKEIENNKKAFKIIADMANAAGSILKVVETMANMTVGVWGTDSKTGELKIISRRPINDNDFELVSKNMGKVMQALIKPLSIIASDEEYWDFGNGIKIKNPFNKINGFFGPKDDMSGVNRIKAIGDAFEKIPAIMQGFCNNPLLTDLSDKGQKKMEILQKNIGIFFDTIVQCMKKLPEKSVLSTWFDGTAKWLKDTVQPVFVTATDIVKKITPGKEGTTKWEYSKTPLCIERIANFWSTTSLILNDIEIASKKKFNDKFATKVISFYNALDELNTNSWLNLTNMDSSVKIASSTKTLVNTLANSKSFSSINNNLEKTNKNIQAIVGNINKIQIPKAQILERNLKLLTDAKSVDQLKEVIEHLKEMIGMLKEVQEEQVKATQIQTEQAQQQFYETKQINANKDLDENTQRASLLTILQKIQLLIEGGGIHALVDLTGINEEIEQALNNCGIGNGNGSKIGLQKNW